MTRRHTAIAITLSLLATFVASRPSVRPDGFSGEWAPVQDEDNTGNPYVGEFLGIPMSRAGQPARAGLERVALHAAGVAVPAARRHVHLARAVAGPHLEGGRPGLATNHRVSRRVAALGRQPVLHGRPPASVRRMAPHTWGGFSTAVFEGEMLKITTTHLKEDYYRRNGVPSSDEATLTQYWIRRGDNLTWVTIAYDPLYLAEPMIRSSEYRFAPNQQIPPYPCTAGRGSRARAGRGAAPPAGHEPVPQGVRREIQPADSR